MRRKFFAAKLTLSVMQNKRKSYYKNYVMFAFPVFSEFVASWTSNQYLNIPYSIPILK